MACLLKKTACSFHFRVPPFCNSFIIPPGGFSDDHGREVLQHGPLIFGRENNGIEAVSAAAQFPVNATLQMRHDNHLPYDLVPRESTATLQGHTIQTSDPKLKSAEQSRNRWVEGEVKLLISIYGEEYKNRDKGRNLDSMWEKIEARLAEESKEVLNIHCQKSAKNCRDKINNLSKKYKNVKDKSKMTGEGSENIKSFPKFDELDQIWGTRDSVNPKYVMEAGMSKSAIATPSPNSSMSSPGSGDGTSFGPLEDSSDEMDETLSLSSAIARPSRSEKTEKGRGQEKKKRSQPSNDDDSNKDEDLEYSSSLFFKKKQKQTDSKKKGKSPKNTKQKAQKGAKKEDEEDEMYAELIKAQTEALKKTEEERRELFDYLRESDNHTQELVLGAIRELGEILKK